ncbi:hypothetical protein FEDK69T_04910 [Flavobacterium enshiense DK69]|nr:hypothetical protein FEDK69T_04910 [Flavobacterium enshiense DK69]
MITRIVTDAIFMEVGVSGYAYLNGRTQEKHFLGRLEK